MQQLKPYLCHDQRIRANCWFGITRERLHLRLFASMVFPCFVVVLLTLLAPSSAWAYIDPGSGLVLWQGLIAVVGAGLLFIRHPWESLKRLWSYLARLAKK